MSLSSDSAVLTMPVQPANTNGSNGFGWGDGGLVWIIILFLFAFCGGWGGNWGNNGNANTGAGIVDGYVLTSDFANIERKMDGINSGLCDGFYQQAQLVNGVQQTVNNGFMSAEISRANQQAAFMQQLFAMQMQAQECCCENRSAIQGVNYNLATQACDTRNTVQNATRDIIDANNQNSRAILDFLVNSKMQDLQSENQNLKLAASQTAQNAYLVSQLRPSPVPAYTVQNPYCQYASCGC